MTDEEYQAAYHQGFEDGQLAFKVWADGPFVVVFINPHNPETYCWSWCNVEFSNPGKLIVEGLYEVAEELEDMIEDSKPEDWDDDE